jgi:hypothetical protein
LRELKTNLQKKKSKDLTTQKEPTNTVGFFFILNEVFIVMSSQTKIIKDILSSYETILENKNLISELEMLPLANMSYSNVNRDNDGTKNDSVNKALVDDIQAAAKAIGVTATITTAKTGHNEQTTTGNKSRHTDGTGVDIAIINGIGSGGATNEKNGNQQFRELGYKLKDALVSMGYIWNTESGNDKAVLWQTNTGGNHFNHLHVSNRTGNSSGTPTVSGSTDSSGTSGTSDADTGTVSTSRNRSFIKKIAAPLLNAIGIREQFSKFGDRIKSSNGMIILPSDENQKILSPVNGRIVNFKSIESCKNQVSIEFQDGSDVSYLVYCGISNPTTYTGDIVLSGDRIGSTFSDVTVTLYNSNGKKEKISYSEKENQSLFSKTTDDRTKNNSYDGDDSLKKKPYKNTDPEVTKALKSMRHGVANLFNIKKNQKNDKGEMVDKRWGSPTSKEQPRDWIINPKNEKKLTENIERIKGLLK